MYFFGLSKEEVLSQKHVASYKETSKQNIISNTVTLFGRKVKRETSYSDDGCMRIKDIDLRLPADHYAYSNFHERLCSNTVEMGTPEEGNKEREDWSGKRDPRIVIDLEELPTTEDGSDKTTNMESGLLDLNTTPDDELVSEPRFLQDLNCPYIEDTETSCEKSGVDDGTESPASYTSCCTTENNVSRRGSSPSCRTRLEFPVLPENERCNEEEEEISEVMQMAAESLVRISTVSYQDQDFQDKPEKGDVGPRCCSCDSYELHTLGISETNTEEEFRVSSMAMDKLNNITRDNNNKEFGLKLRRGRRMKNFQKEILPSLTSLTRHEIREDMNILEAVLRSREYKKMQGKTKDVSFGANTRNKRLVSQRYVGKRRRKHE